LSSPEAPAAAATVVRLKPGRERSLRRRHPWVFSGAVAGVEGDAAAPVADIVGADGAWLGRGLWHAGADLAARVLSWDPAVAVDGALVADRIDRAVRRRDEILAARPPARETDAWRLVFSEADGLSGMIVDRYADVLSVKIGARAWQTFLPGAIARLRERTGARAVVVTAESDAVRREGLEPAAVTGLSDAFEPPVRIREDGLRFEADPLAGQKTGFFLDQRENRARVAAYARGRRVLSAYCYTGAFEVHAAKAGAASIIGIDLSEAALGRARRHHELNGTAGLTEYLRADVPEALRRFRDERRDFDLIILDPPRFVYGRAQLERGLRAYKDINLLAMKLLTPGGILATFSCSGLVSHEEFAAMLGWAALDAGREARVIEWLGQPFDHPILATVPESAYLKGAICRIEPA
jgi:23S rRNA (cytosine1962-C5)-methyltransferase